MTQVFGYTVVQHSGFVWGGHSEFKQGLESRSLTAASKTKVEQAGGKVFATYQEAEAYAEAQMYPEGHKGLTPAAKGKFSTYKIDGLAIYLE